MDCKEEGMRHRFKNQDIVPRPHEETPSGERAEVKGDTGRPAGTRNGGTAMGNVRFVGKTLLETKQINELVLQKKEEELEESCKMENYYKGKNVEPELSKEHIPIPNLPKNFIWMKVSGGSKMRNLLTYALKEFENERAIVWSGSGCAIGKVISCVEIMKRHYTNAFQISKICYIKNEEYWEPYFKEMDSIVVDREVPTMHVLLSKDELNKEEPGYQAPGTCEAWRSKGQDPKESASGSSARRNTSSKISPEQFAAMGLRSNQKRAP